MHMKPYKNERGVTVIEYALLAALIVVVAIAAITTVGLDVKAIFEYIATKLTVPA